MEEIAIMTQSFGFSSVAACNPMCSNEKYSMRESGIPGSRNLPAGKNLDSHNLEDYKAGAYMAGKQGFPQWFDVDITGLWEHK